MFTRFITSAVMGSVLALTIPFTATTVEAAQTRYCTCRTRHHRTAYRRTTYRRPAAYRSEYGYSNSYASVRRPNVYQRHRRLFNTLIGSGAGALVGGLIGGRRGAGIGLIGGGLGSQVFTHYQRPQNYARYRRP